MSAQNIALALNKKRYWLFPKELSGDRSNTWTQTVAVLQKVVAALNQYSIENPKSRLYVVGHDMTGSTMVEQMTKGKELAESVASKLNSLGFKHPLNVESVGGLAPGG